VVVLLEKRALPEPKATKVTQGQPALPVQLEPLVLPDQLALMAQLARLDLRVLPDRLVQLVQLALPVKMAAAR
jgi:hypothetical protein